jgi:hypothetical protein
MKRFVNKEPFFQDWHCPNEPPDHVTRLQQVHYGHISDGRFIEDQVTEWQCVWCHERFTADDLGINPPSSDGA